MSVLSLYFTPLAVQYMTQRNRWGRIERGLQLWNQRQADRIVGLLCSMYERTMQAHAAAQSAVQDTLCLLLSHGISNDQVGSLHCL